MKTLTPLQKSQTLSDQLSMPLDLPELRGLNPSERRFAVARLAALLMAAAGVASRETSNDE